MIELNNVCKSYAQADRKLEILKALNFKLEKGKTAAVLGASGSGKSTFLSLVAGLDFPDSGEVLFLGKNLQQLSDSSLTSLRAQHMGIVFQQFHLLPHLTALENVTLPLEIARQEPATATSKAREVLKQVGLGDRLEHFPAELSGGEQQRVAIARALVSNPELLLADEPSGNLDEQTGQGVMQLFFNLVKEWGTSLILVTHNRELARSCHAHYLLEHGNVRELRL